MDKLYYTISEVAGKLEETTSTVRFWSNNFAKFMNPKRNAKGNRMFRPEDIAVLEKIQYMTRECGLSLDAVMRKLSEMSSGTDKSLLLRDSLLRMREQLVNIKNNL